MPTPAPIRFYSTRAEHGCFSNFWRVEIVIDGLTWRSTEHFYQAQKCVWGGKVREPWFSEIHRAPTPREAARLGRSAPLRPDWSEVRECVMWAALLVKFGQHPELLAKLLDTAPAELIEDSPVDYFWGCGRDGSGENRLGRMLVEVRDVFAGARQVPETDRQEATTP